MEGVGGGEIKINSFFLNLMAVSTTPPDKKHKGAIKSALFPTDKLAQLQQQLQLIPRQ
mgnify:CR=1 FL=1